MKFRKAFANFGITLYESLVEPRTQLKFELTLHGADSFVGTPLHHLQTMMYMRVYAVYLLNFVKKHSIPIPFISQESYNMYTQRYKLCPERKLSAEMYTICYFFYDYTTAYKWKLCVQTEVEVGIRMLVLLTIEH